MKRTLTLTALVFAGALAFTPTASAGDRWSFNFGFGLGGGFFEAGYRHKHRHHHGHFQVHHRPVLQVGRVCHHVRRPIYHKVWVAPVYRTVVVGYDHCGTPITRTVVVTPGYYRHVVRGYRCGHCGIGL